MMAMVGNCSSHEINLQCSGQLETQVDMTVFPKLHAV
jgi:hypothetical protein